MVVRRSSRFRLHSSRFSIFLIAAILIFGLQNSRPAYAATFSNSEFIALSDGNAVPYPSTISVSGQAGNISDVNVTLKLFTHPLPDDVDILLVAPNGTGVVLMSDACGTTPIANANLTFDDQTANFMTDTTACGGNFYKPSNFSPADTFSGFSGSIGSTLSTFSGTNPNGTWSLYAVDDTAFNTGSIALGWELEITVTPANIGIPGTGTNGKANPYPSIKTVSGMTGVVNDVNVVLTGLTHSNPDDIDMLLVSPAGTAVVLMSDACGTTDMNNVNITIDGLFAANLSDSGACSNSTSQPVNYGGGDTYPTPAPGGTQSDTSLASFNGEDPNGDWKLYINDDASGGGGYLITGWNLQIFTEPAPIAVPGTGTSGIANPYPVDIVVSGETGVVSLVTVNLLEVTHPEPDDLDVLLVSPNGIAVMLMSDACGGTALSDQQLRITDLSNTGPFPDTAGAACGGVGFINRPVNYDDDETMPSPAPVLPYSDRLSLFDGINPNGTWKVYIQDDSAGNSGTIGSVSLEIDTVASMPNRIQNSGFGSGENNWLEFGGGSGSVVSGVYEFQRTSASDAFTVFQTTSADWDGSGAGTRFELRFDMGNSDTQRKRITVLIWDEAFGAQRACSFWLDANQPLRTYQIISDIPAETTWTNVTVHFYASSVRTNANGFYRLDNVILRERPDFGLINHLLCIDPTAPPADAAVADGANLVTNGTFTSAIGNGDGTWGPAGSINFSINSGVLNMQKTGDGAVILQNTNVPVSANETVELALSLGNTAATWQRITILLHHETFSDLQFCTFWIPPGVGLQTYTMRTYADTTWNSQGITVSLYPSTTGASIQVDNVVLRKRQGTKIIGVGCYEPGSNQPALDDWMQAQLDALIQPTLMPTATGVPYTAPGMAGELPILATPSAPMESGSGNEGTVGE